MKIKKNEIVSILKRLGLGLGDCLMVHSDLKMFGLYREIGKSIKMSLNPEILYDSLRCVIGDEGTLIVPTFTYSFGALEIFERSSTPSKMGIFSEYVRRIDGSVRTKHPILSICANGPMADCFIDGVSTSSYGKESPYDMMYKHNVKQLMLGVSVCSFKDYVEWQFDVPFRYSKYFKGWAVDQGINKITEWEHCVRYVDQNLKPIPFLDAVWEDGKDRFDIVTLGNGCAAIISSKDMYDLVFSKLHITSYYSSKEPKNKKSIEWLSKIVKENKHTRSGEIKCSWVAFDESGIEKWLWEVENITLIEECKIELDDGSFFIEYLECDVEIFINEYFEDGVNCKMSGEELREHCVENICEITKKKLEKSRWVMKIPTEKIKTIEANFIYNIKIVLNNPKRTQNNINHKYIFILPGQSSVKSGSQIALSAVEKLVSNNDYIDETERKKFILSLCKQKPLIGILKQHDVSIRELPFIEQDIFFS